MDQMYYSNIRMVRPNMGRYPNQLGGTRHPRPPVSVTHPMHGVVPMHVWTNGPPVRNHYPMVVPDHLNHKNSTDITESRPTKPSMCNTESQTDFPKEIADLHLKELPNSLYLHKDKVKIENINGVKKTESSTNQLLVVQDMAANVMTSGTHPRGSKHQRTLSTDFSLRAKTVVVQAEGKEHQSSEAQEKIQDTTDTKKKRKRNRKKKKVKGENAENNENAGHGAEEEINIRLEDELEFPDLSGSKRAPGIVAVPVLENSTTSNLNSPGQPNQPLESENVPDHNSENFEVENESNDHILFKQAAETKNARKRRKRRDQANKAANDEMAEITIEQQMLQELGLKAKRDQGPAKEAAIVNTPTPAALKPPKTANGSGKNNRKSNQPIALDFAAMIDALEQKRDDAITTKNAPKKHIIKKKVKPELEPPRRPHNPLDSTCPKVKRGKEREFPKPKKPSPLKKVILKEREEKKRMRLLEEDPSGVSGGSQVCVGVVNPESDLSQDEDKGKGSASAELSPVSQTSPFSMSPLSPSASPLQSGFNSPIAKDSSNPALLKIHSRRYREYCTQMLEKDIDNCCLQFLQNLVRYQDKQYHKDPKKAKSKRRIVLGLREVTKHLKLQKIRCVIISPNLEKIQSKGGLDDALNNILNMCTEQEVPYVFALGRRALGRACAKLVPVSVVGVFNFEGSERQFWRLIELTQKATDSYKEMVSSVEKDLQENPNNRAGLSGVPNLFAHMGHSRTPSGCSAISFTSSILSEPISENYPYSEPETDSKGYEVSKSSRSQVTGIQSSVINEQSNANYETDAGNEADTEDYLEPVEPSKSPQPYFSHTGDSDEDEDPDNIEDLPHIDSIHYGNYDLSVEILSQHSSRTIENSEAMSTHSSRTLRDGSPTMLLEKLNEKHSSSSQQKTIDKDRIKSWVEATQGVADDTRVDSGSAEEEPGHPVEGEEELCDISTAVEKEEVATAS